MSRQQLQARDKVRGKMTRDGLVEINETRGEVKRVSSREAEVSLRDTLSARESFSRRGNPGEAPKKGKQRSQRHDESQAAPPGNQQEYVQEHGGLLPQTEAEQAPVPREPQAAPQAAKRNARYRAEAEAPHGEGLPEAQHNPRFHDGEPSKLIHDAPFPDDIPASALSHDIPAPALRHERPGHFDRQPDTQASKYPRKPGQQAPSVVRDSGESAVKHDKQQDSQRRHEQCDVLLRHERSDALPVAQSGIHATRDRRNIQQKNAPVHYEQPAPPKHSVSSTAPPRGQAAPPVQSSASGRVRFTADEATPPTKPNRAENMLTKAERGVERGTAKLEAAQGKLPTKKRLRSARVFDEPADTPKHRLRFESEVKPQSEHMRGALHPVKAAGNAAIAVGHHKLYQNQKENVGTEAAHILEIAAEGGVRTALRLHKTAPYRKVARLERTVAKKSTKLSYQRALAENPKLRSNPISRFVQKQKIKRQYAKAAWEAKRGAKIAQAAGSYSAKAAKVLAGFVRSHPVAAGVILLLFLFFAVLLSMGGIASSMGGSGLGGVLGGAYLAENADIDSAEIAYTEWETDLREEMDTVETDRPDYDEYLYELGEIGHDPHILMSYLTAAYLDYTYAEIAGDLREIFDEQYVLTYTETVETRYADPDDEDEDGDYEPYNWNILTVKLAVTPLADVLTAHMDEEAQSHYEVLLGTKGGRQFAGNPFAFDWTPYITSYYGWRLDPITGEKSFHNGIDIGVPIGTPIIAAHDGVVSQVVNGSTGYGKYITIEGENGISTRYAHCDALLAAVGQEVAQGEVIAASGNTGNSTGPHLHYEVMMNGSTFNPIYFAESGT